MTRFENLTNAYDYLNKRLMESDDIVRIYDIDNESLYVAIVISANNVVYEYSFDCNDYFKVKLLH